MIIYIIRSFARVCASTFYPSCINFAFRVSAESTAYSQQTECRQTDRQSRWYFARVYSPERFHDCPRLFVLELLFRREIRFRKAIHPVKSNPPKYAQIVLASTKKSPAEISQNGPRRDIARSDLRDLRGNQLRYAMRGGLAFIPSFYAIDRSYIRWLLVRDFFRCFSRAKENRDERSNAQRSVECMSSSACRRVRGILKTFDKFVIIVPSMNICAVETFGKYCTASASAWCVKSSRTTRSMMKIRHGIEAAQGFKWRISGFGWPRMMVDGLRVGFHRSLVSVQSQRS